MSTAAGPQVFLPHSGQWVPARRVVFIEATRQRSLANWIEQLKRKAHPARIGRMAVIELRDRESKEMAG